MLNEEITKIPSPSVVNEPQAPGATESNVKQEERTELASLDSNSPAAAPGSQDAILAQGQETLPGPDQNPANQIQKFPEIDRCFTYLKSELGYLLTMTEEEKAIRRKDLYTSRSFHFATLITKNENGTNNYDEAIEYIRFLEECVKDLKTCHIAADLTKRGFISEASASERARIQESDKKYEPKYKERKKVEKEKMTTEEKKIQDFMKLGLTRAAAEKIIFAKGWENEVSSFREW